MSRNAIPSATSHATFATMLFELWSSVANAGPQFKQHCQKHRVGRRAGCRADNRVGVFRALCLHCLAILFLVSFLSFWSSPISIHIYQSTIVFMHRYYVVSAMYVYVHVI